MNRHTAALAALGLAVVVSSADAQQRWAFEARLNGDVPTQKVQNHALGTGYGVEGTFRYGFMPHLAAYAGWDWISFVPQQSFAGPDMDFDETGYVFGLRFEHPLSGESGIAAWARGGGTIDHVEIKDASNDMVADSGHGLGWEAAAGLAVPVGGAWSLTPGARYRSLSRNVEIGNVTTGVDMRYVAFEIGIARWF